MSQSIEPYLITAGGKIYCRRCKAKSRKAQRQCGKPALKNKAVCQIHGGRSTGPRTQDGKQRVRAAHLKHGQETLQAKAERSAKSAMFRYLTDLGNYCNLFHKQLKIRGRIPLAYIKRDLTDQEQLKFVILKIMKDK